MTVRQKAMAETIAKWVCSIALLMALSFIYYLNMGLTTSKVLYIPQGSIRKIITHLETANPQLNRLDAFLLRFVGQPQHGWIDLDFIKKPATSYETPTTTYHTGFHELQNHYGSE